MKTKAFIRLRSWLHISSFAAVLLLSFSAHAQWGWTDKDGRRIFSDQSPGTEVPEGKIFKRPANAKKPAAVVNPSDTASAPAPGTSAPKAAASAPKLTGKDAELEKKKKDADAAEAASKKSAADKQAAEKTENCARAKQAKATMGSGIRIANTNAKGEREIMSDTDRAAEVKRLDGVIAVDCK
jgi:type IV secretory pathway VirB10-like protein